MIPEGLIYMANEEYLALLKTGVDAWNDWRQRNPEIQPDLSEADLSSVDLIGVNLRRVNLYRANFTGADLRGVIFNGADVSGANFTGADLSWTNLEGANLNFTNLSQVNLSWNNLRKSSLCKSNLTGANLTGVDLYEVNLMGADFTGAELTQANLGGTELTWANFTGAKLPQVSLNAASLYQANFSGADLSGANLIGAQLIETNFENANLSGAKIYGISAWNVNLKGAKQSNLVITREYKGEPTITVDQLKVAQFIYLLLNNEEIRDVIDTITSKVVLILGRFNGNQLPVLKAIREELRRHNYSPVLFDFTGSDNRNITETVSTLAHMARFVIADITEPKAVHQELAWIIPKLPSVPVQLLLHASANAGGMIEDFLDYDWVLEEYKYDSLDHLIGSFKDNVIAPAEAKAKELLEKRWRRLERRSKR
jgi:uncharacterized protein YjbI with pentapeptide repeats